MTHLRPGGLPDCHDPWGPATEQDKECADPQEWEAAYSPLPSPTQQDADAARFRWLCKHPDWTYIERLCRRFVAESEGEFYAALSAAIDGQMRTETALDVGATAAAATPEPHIPESADPAAPLLVQPLSSHEVTMAVETAWEAAEQEILDGEPPRYGEHVATLIQHACAEKWGIQLGDTGTKP